MEQLQKQIWKNRNFSENNFRSTFFRKKMDSLADISVESEILKVFELYSIETINELFKQVRCEASTHYIDSSESNLSQYPTPWNLKGLLPSNYNRTVLNNNQ